MQQARALPKGNGPPHKGIQSLQVYPKWAMDGVERRFSQLTSKGNNNPNTQDTAGTKPTSTHAKPRAKMSYLIPRAYVKVLRRSAVSMAYRPTSRAIEPLKTSWFPLRIRIPWKTKVGPSTGSNVENLCVMRNI